MTARQNTQADQNGGSKKTGGPGWPALAVLCVLMGFASISTDLYLPAMPTMGRALGAQAGEIELSVTGYLIGFSLGQLLWGPLGDRFGRRPPVAAGLALFVVGTAGCALAAHAAALVGWRVVQALGACAAVVLARAMVRDLYDGRRAAQALSALMTVMAAAPLLGPSVGGLILDAAGWRAIFWTLAGVGVATLAALALLPETLPLARRNREALRRVLPGYGALLRQRRILGYAAAGGCFHAGMFAYIAGASFAYVDYHQTTPRVFGALFAANVAGVMIVNMLNVRLAARLGGDRLLLLGTAAAALAGAALAATAGTGWGGVWGLAVPLFVYVSAAGFIVANAIAGALAGFPDRAGAVSALVGALQYGCGIAGSALVGVLADGTPRPMAWVIAAAGAGGLACAWALAGPAGRRMAQPQPLENPR